MFSPAWGEEGQHAKRNVDPRRKRVPFVEGICNRTSGGGFRGSVDSLFWSFLVALFAGPFSLRMRSIRILSRSILGILDGFLTSVGIVAL
jgi:hypothetical protein